MAKYWTNRGRYALPMGTFNSSTKNLVALTGTAPSQATIADYNFLSDLITGGVAEVAVSGYARVAYTVTPAEDDTNDRANLVYTATPSFGATVAVGATITMVALINTAGGADTARELYWVDVLATPLPTNGSGMGYTSATDTLA